jgi:hypothetical protein
MSGSASGSDSLGRLADEILERYRRGERPTPTEYAERHPDLAEQIRELFPALVLLEDVRPGPPAALVVGALVSLLFAFQANRNAAGEKQAKEEAMREVEKLCGQRPEGGRRRQPVRRPAVAGPAAARGARPGGGRADAPTAAGLLLPLRPPAAHAPLSADRAESRYGGCGSFPWGCRVPAQRRKIMAGNVMNRPGAATKEHELAAAVGHLGDKARDAGAAVAEKAHEAWDSTTRGVSHAASYTADQAEDLLQSTINCMRRYPVATFFVGLGLGIFLVQAFLLNDRRG